MSNFWGAVHFEPPFFSAFTGLAEPLFQMFAAVEIVNRKSHPAGEQHDDRCDHLAARGDVFLENVHHAPDSAYEADQPNNSSNYNNLNLV